MGPERHISHIFTIDDIDDVTSRFFRGSFFKQSVCLYNKMKIIWLLEDMNSIQYFFYHSKLKFISLYRHVKSSIHLRSFVPHEFVLDNNKS